MIAETIKLQRPGTDENSRATVEGRINGNPFRLTLDTNKPTQRYICDLLQAKLVYEPESTFAIIEALNPGDMFFDVGANCGWFSAVALTCGAKVTAFEPHPDNCAALRMNAPAADIIRAVVSDITGDGTLFLNLDNDGGHALWPCGKHPYNEATVKAGNPMRIVPAVRLDDYAERSPVAIKIDTEGAECNVLLGAEKALSNPTLRLVVCERHPMGLQLMKHSVGEVESIMGRHGFKWDSLTGNEINNWIFRR